MSREANRQCVPWGPAAALRRGVAEGADDASPVGCVDRRPCRLGIVRSRSFMNELSIFQTWRSTSCMFQSRPERKVPRPIGASMFGSLHASSECASTVENSVPHEGVNLI